MRDADRGSSRRRARLARLLQLAYSAELGAAIAYAGHAASVSDPAERDHISCIRNDELDHRARLGRMLRQLQVAPDVLLEVCYRCIGSGIGGFCRVGGWFLPMYGAGWLEYRNIGDYELAARLSVDCDQTVFADELLDMAEAEWDHERFFRLKAASHWLSAVLRIWQTPTPKHAIRQRFAEFLTQRTAAGPAPLGLELAWPTT